jgi:hypothetical protein
MKFRFMVCGLGSVVAVLSAAAQTNPAPVEAVEIGRAHV